MVDETKCHTKNGLVQKKFYFYNTGFQISVNIATGVCGESTCLVITDTNCYPDDDSRSLMTNKEYVIPIDDSNDLLMLSIVLKRVLKERDKTLIKK